MLFRSGFGHGRRRRRRGEIDAGRFAADEYLGREFSPPPPVTAFGALLAHITGGGDAKTFQPMNCNFGLFPPLENVPTKGKKHFDRKKAHAHRAAEALDAWLGRSEAAQ